MDLNASGSGRPLTRRELRALAAERGDAAAAPVEWPTEAPADTAEEPAVEPLAQDSTGDLGQSAVAPEPWAGLAPAAASDAGATMAGATMAGTTWSDDVRWSLRGELPREVRDEPEDDDVRWDFPEQTVPVGPPVDSVPTRTSVWSRVPAEPVATEGTEATELLPVEDQLAGEPPEPERAPVDALWADEQPPADAPVRPAEEPPAPELAPPAAAPWPIPDEPGLLGPIFPAPPVPPGPPAPPVAEAELPTLSDLLAARPTPPAGPAEQGWQGTVRRITGGLLALRPGPAEQRHRSAVASVQRSLDGPRTIVVINPKGGAHKTTATLLLAATFGQYRGGYTLAWDNNETRGTLGWRARQATHHRTAVDLFADLDRFADPGSARVGDLDNYVRAQGSAQFDVLASDEDAASAASIDDFAFRALHRTLARFYRVMVIDTGNNMRASNWQAAVAAADQVVIVSTVREDTAQSAAWAIDALRATGREDVVRSAVTVLSDPAPRRDPQLTARLHDHFGRLTRAVIDVPYDRSLVGGTPLEADQLSRRTREAWLRVAAAVAEGL